MMILKSILYFCCTHKNGNNLANSKSHHKNRITTMFKNSDHYAGNPIYDKDTSSIKFQEIVDFIVQLNRHDVVLLHPC
mgnify:CR=1 FL=1